MLGGKEDSTTLSCPPNMPQVRAVSKRVLCSLKSPWCYTDVPYHFYLPWDLIHSHARLSVQGPLQQLNQHPWPENHFLGLHEALALIWSWGGSQEQSHCICFRFASFWEVNFLSDTDQEKVNSSLRCLQTGLWQFHAESVLDASA